MCDPSTVDVWQKCCSQASLVIWVWCRGASRSALIFNFRKFFCSDVAGGSLRAPNSKPCSRMQVEFFVLISSPLHSIYLININHTVYFLLWWLLLENKFLCNLSKMKCRNLESKLKGNRNGGSARKEINSKANFLHCLHRHVAMGWSLFWTSGNTDNFVCLRALELQ